MANAVVDNWVHPALQGQSPWSGAETESNLKTKQYRALNLTI